MRAQRFVIPMPLRYRRSGEEGWQEGRVENISRSGVLFQAGRLIDVKEPVEMSFQLPVEIGGSTRAEVFCVGEIVRTLLPATSDVQPAMAARTLHYRFVRRQTTSEA